MEYIGRERIARKKNLPGLPAVRMENGTNGVLNST